MTTSTPIPDLISELLTSRYDIDPAEITPDAAFEDLALDSLALMEMALVLERRLGVAIAEGVLAPSQTLHEAAAVLRALPAA